MLEKQTSDNVFSHINKLLLLTIPIANLFLMPLPLEYRELFYLNLESIQQGEYWRFFTGHIIHYSWLHWAINSLALTLYIFIFYTHLTWRILYITTYLIIFISVGLLLFSHHLLWYVGFSGVLTGLFIYSSIRHFSQQQRISVTILLITLVYVGFQFASGELLESDLYEIKTSSYAHAYGFLGGLILGSSAIMNRVIMRNLK